MNEPDYSSKESMRDALRDSVKQNETLRAELDKAQRDRCPDCGAKLYYGPPPCPWCGAPNCCPQCCKINTLETELKQAQRERDDWREHAALTDKEILQLSDWLISNAEFDPKTGLIDRCAKLKERVRDLIAAEGEVGDLKEQLTRARSDLAACEKGRDGLRIRIIELESTFSHTHISNHQNDLCGECGMDLRDPIHNRLIHADTRTYPNEL